MRPIYRALLAGEHARKFTTEGQQNSVVDLDIF